MPSESHNPWDRQPDEPSKAFAGFVIYRDLGPGRTLDAAFKASDPKRQDKVPHGGWTRWFSIHSWKARATAYDSELDRVRLAKRREIVEDMVERHAKACQAGMFAALAALQEINRAIQAKTFDLIDKKNAWIHRIWLLSLIDALKAERISIGEPTTIQKQISEDAGDKQQIVEYIDQLVDELVAEGRI